MEQDSLISFSSVVATLLLLDRNITSVEIVNFLSRLDCEDIGVSDENDEVDDLLRCVVVKPSYSYSLKDDLEYDTFIFSDVTVHGFLCSFVDKRVFDLILSDSIYSEKYFKNIQKNERIKEFYHSNSISSDNEFELGDVKLKKEKKLIKRNPWSSFLGGIR